MTKVMILATYAICPAVLLAESDTMMHGDMKHGEMKHGKMKHGSMTHAPVDVSDWPTIPTLTLTAHKDTLSGWNLHIMPTGFRFAPQHVNASNKPGEGHAHLYINGEKITRLYSDWYYLNNLGTGEHTITVTLNANDHGELVNNGQIIEASIELTQE